VEYVSSVVTVVPLRYGTAFKKAFGDPEVFSAFVRDVIGKEFHFNRVEQEKGLLAPRGAIDIRFDLYAEDELTNLELRSLHSKSHRAIKCKEKTALQDHARP
jgi:hypothetical protein